MPANPAWAECFNCNYGLAICMLASLAVAGVTALVGLGWFISLRRVPRAVLLIFLASAAPSAELALVDFLNLV